MSTFFRGITEAIPSLFRGIFSERNSVPNPTLHLISPCCTLHTFNGYGIFSEADQHEKSARDGQDGQGTEDQQKR